MMGILTSGYVLTNGNKPCYTGRVRRVQPSCCYVASLLPVHPANGSREGDAARKPGSFSKIFACRNAFAGNTPCCDGSPYTKQKSNESL